MSTIGLSTPAMDEVFSPESLVTAMLEFESALARALAETGIAPRERAEAVVAACSEPVSNPSQILGTTWESGSPVIALVELIEQRLDDEEDARWVHFGATSQDVIDTAHMLLARRGLTLLEDSIARTASLIRVAIESHRHQPQIGRTFLQHAIPTVFSMRAASWLDSLLHHLTAMRSARSALAVQLGGPVGNLGAYGARGLDVSAALADLLDLEAPGLPWHTDRSRVWELVGAVERPVASVAKIATDIALLAQTDTGEISARPGGSSSMPHKRNPIDAIRALAAADIAGGAARMIVGARPHELDRGLGSWHVEWVALPLLFRSAAAAFEAAEGIFETIEIDTAAMAARAVTAASDTNELDTRLIDRVLDESKQVLEDR